MKDDLMYTFPPTLWESNAWNWSGSCTFLAILIVALIYFVRLCPVGDIAGFLWAIATCTLICAFLAAYPGQLFRGGTMWTPTLFLIAVVVAVIGHVWQQRASRKQNKPAGVGAFLGWTFMLLFLAYSPRLGGTYEGARRTQCKNNLKQLGLALHSYHDEFDTFPAAASGSPFVSWRVKLSPYLDENEILKRYDVDAEWDSESNRPLQTERRSMFDCPSRPISTDDQQRFLTSYLAIAGPGTIFDGANGKTIRDIEDGTSNTLMIGEACGTNVIWTDPRDQLVDQVPQSLNEAGSVPGQSPSLMSSYHQGGAQALLADGSVRFVSQNIDPTVLKSLITRAGGETIDEW